MRDGRLARVPASDLSEPRELVFLGVADGRDLVAAAYDDAPRLDGVEFVGLRRVLPALAASGQGIDLELATAAVAMAVWHERSAICASCGTRTASGKSGWVRVCQNDGIEHYPRTDPAVIVAITDPDDRLLLAHVSYHSPRRYSHLAGYVEPGETLEQAAHREVAEEAGIALASLAYVGSQPWPFPASIMVAFRATTASATIAIDNDEVTDARWFTREELGAAVLDGEVLLAPPGSIARALIHDWYGGAVREPADVG